MFKGKQAVFMQQRYNIFQCPYHFLIKILMSAYGILTSVLLPAT